MPESKFLKYQDKNNDGLIDVCEDKVIVAPIDNCEECKPNPKAVVPNWKNLTINEPFLNERTADYQVTKVTPYTDTGGQGLGPAAAASILEGRFDEFVYEALKSILQDNGKDTSSSTLEGVKPHVEYKNYFFDADRASSRLKLLYSIPCDVLNAVIDSAGPEDEDQDSGADSVVIGEVTYQADELLEKLRKVRSGIGLYATYLEVYKATESGNLIFESGDYKGSLFSPHLYGDWSGFNKKTLLYQMGAELSSFLNGHKIRMPGTFVTGLSLFGDVAKIITFKFGEGSTLTELIVYTEDCGSKPKIFSTANGDLSALSSKSVYQDPTAINYLLRLDIMERDLTARVPKPWLDFFIEHTAPKIYSSINHAHENDLAEGTVKSCVADALLSEGKQLGQDLLSETFSLVDSILYKFNDQLCNKTLEEMEGNFSELGLVRDPKTGAASQKSIWAFAQEQAFGELDRDDTVFDAFCAKLLAAANGESGADATLEKLYAEDLAEIKGCGFSELMMEAVGCLLKGLTLEEAMSRMIKAALGAMDIQNFGALWKGLPPDKQAELDALVKKKLENDDVFPDQGRMQGASNNIDAALKTSAPGGTVERPWEVRDRTATSTAQESARPMLEDLNLGSATNRSQLDTNVVFQAYLNAVLEVYSDNFLDLLEELNQLPGADIVSMFITTLDCPRPPSNTANKLSFIKNYQANRGWKNCSSPFEIAMPPFQNPAAWMGSFPDLWGKLQKAAILALQEMIIKMTTIVLARVCKLLSTTACKTLGAVGDVIGSLPEIAGGRDTFANVIKDTICGDDADSGTVDDTIVDMMANLGLGAAAFADEQKLLNFVQDISENATAQEWAMAFNGEAPPALLEIIQSIIELEYPEYKAALPTEEHIANMFTQVGNLMPVAERAGMAAAAAAQGPAAAANPSLCATPEQQKQFEERRCQLMQNRASEDQCAKLQPDYGSDLEEIAGWAQAPPFEIPQLFSDPGCDNGIFPFESELTTKGATAVLTGELESLKTKFTTDMLGNGILEEDWGLFNMILSDTQGNPFTTHSRKVSNDIGKQQYVDLYVDNKDAGDDTGNYDKIADQYGAYPIKVSK